MTYNVPTHIQVLIENGEEYEKVVNKVIVDYLNLFNIVLLV